MVSFDILLLEVRLGYLLKQDLIYLKRDFIKMFVAIYSIGQSSNLICPFSTHCQMKWYFVS